jgi:MFS transporter, ACS family, hexuronate transporter
MKNVTAERARETSAAAGAKIKHLRWYICALLFFATTINYIDRQVLGTLAPELKTTIGWSELEYGRIVIAFQISYAVMMLISGRIIDKIGTKLGFAIAIVWWSLAAMAHALAGSARGFGVARFFLGVGEAANFPASVKTVAEWFPKSERALATGIFNAGTNVGAILAPATALWLSAAFGWQSAFIVTGAVGFIWLIFWWLLYERPERHARLSAEEFALIRQDDAQEGAAQSEASTEQVPWLRLLGYRQLWAFALGKMLTDPIWWFYLFWLPKFLNEKHGIKGLALIPYLTTVYVIADVGSVGGGWISSALIKRGWSVNAARKTAFLIFASCMPFVIIASQTESAWLAVTLIGVAAAAHQGWSANIFTIPSDMFPRKAIGSVIGIGACAGGLGGILVAEFAGQVLNANPSFYLPMFIVAGVAYFVALGIIQLLAPKLEPVRLD